MQVFKKSGMHIHYCDEGDPNGAPLVFSGSLGTVMRLWDKVISSLPKGALGSFASTCEAMASLIAQEPPIPWVT